MRVHRNLLTECLAFLLLLQLLAVAMNWIPKTPIYLIGSLIVMFILLLHPIWNFWWIEKTKTRRVTAILIYLICLSLFGYSVWPSQTPQKAEVINQTKESVSQKPLKPPSALIQKNKDEQMDRPRFGIDRPVEIKTKPPFQIEIIVKNIGKHIAFNLHGREIIVDQQFQTKPVWNDSSDVNENPPEIYKFFRAGLTFPPSVATLVPIYVVFAIKYQDKESTSKTFFRQIWYFKTMEAWVIDEKGTSPVFFDVTIPERENILSHLKQELKGYL